MSTKSRPLWLEPERSPGGTDKNPNYESEGSQEGSGGGLWGGGGAGGRQGEGGGGGGGGGRQHRILYQRQKRLDGCFSCFGGLTWLAAFSFALTKWKSESVTREMW